MSIVYVTNVVVGRNPSSLLEPFELEISFECLEPLELDLEWRLIYVGSAEDKTKDQELDSIALGPIERGALRFIFTADPPDYTKIDKEDINGITIILLSGSYRNQEFVRVGWYVHNFFYEPQYIEIPPDLDELTLEEMIPKMRRVILADNPRITRFNIDWDRPNLETSLMVMSDEGPASSVVDNTTNRSTWNCMDTTSSNGNVLPGGMTTSSALDTRMTGNLSTVQTNENIEQGMSTSESMCNIGMDGIGHQNGFPVTANVDHQHSIQTMNNGHGVPQFQQMNHEGWKVNLASNHSNGCYSTIPEDTDMGAN